jgi:rhodanese-related sulfurtransferase
MIYEMAEPHALGYREALAVDAVEGLGQARFVDVREPHEFTGELGHLEGSELVPLATVEAASASWDKDAELVLVCRSGARSGRIAAVLVSKGFTKVINLKGGMLAVHAAKLPFVR